MSKIIIEGKTIDEAISLAATQLSVTLDKVNYTVTNSKRHKVIIEAWNNDTNIANQSKLINCPDCGKEISRKAQTCPNCGCPIEKTILCPYCNIDTNKTYKEIQQLGCKIICNNCGKEVLVTNTQQEIYYKIKKEHQSNIPKCPKCGSTAITAGARGVNFTWGLIGASKTVNRCANCGHTWKP